MKLIKKLNRKYNRNYGLFFCTYCNKEVKKQLDNGKVAKSCGCMRAYLSGKSRKLHGDRSKDSNYKKLYTIWKSMKQRCYYKKSKSYKDYGGRGIKICKEWKNNYLKFKEWALENNWKEVLEIDRKDNNGNYEPNNCRFTNNTINNRNRRNVKLTIEKAKEIRKLYKEESISQRKLGKILNITQAAISKIINNKIWKEISNVSFGN